MIRGKEEMKVIFSEEHAGHTGAKEMRYDELIPLSESPDRIEIILNALRANDIRDIQSPNSFGLKEVLRIHDPNFVKFLEECYPLWVEQFGPGGFATAYTFGMRSMKQVPNRSVHSMLSCYTFDVCVPFVEGTWKAINSSKDVALTGAEFIRNGQDSIFSLCRPPGHHASKDLAGGYCYLNNVAISAQYYLDNGASRVAILDIDYHHGNGTQTIFYERSDVFFTSLHCRPEEEYPFLLGYANEIGLGLGENYNLNFPMKLGTNYETWKEALSLAITEIKKYGPEVLLVSLGVDTFSEDPVGGFNLLSYDFLNIGKEIKAINIPTHFVMEGGYAKKELGQNVSNVILGFLN